MPAADLAPIDEVVIAAATGEAVGAFYADGVLVGLELGAQRSERRAGEIVLGRVHRAERQLAAAFVDIGNGASGFLNHADAAASGLSPRLPTEGEAVLVQISREAEGAKAAKLTTDVVLPGRTVIHCPGRADIRVSRRICLEGERRRASELARGLPPPGAGWLIRRAAVSARPEAVFAEADELTEQWQRLQRRAAGATAPVRLYRPPDPLLAAVAEAAGPGLRRIRADDAAILAAIRTFFPEVAAACQWDAVAGPLTVDAAIDAALEPSVALSGGGVLHIAETPALVAIDVDAGNRRSGNSDETALAANLEAVAVLAREVKVRDLAGHMVIDFVGMRRRAHRERVVAALRMAFAQDRQETHVAGYTRLGKVEMSRRRVRGSLRSRLTAMCRRCDGSGAVVSSGRAAHASLRAVLGASHGDVRGHAVVVVATPDIIAALRGSAAPGLTAVEARLGRALSLREDPSMPVSTFRIETERDLRP